MSETNGGNRLNDHEERLANLEAARRELEDSFIVMTHLETKAAARVKEHAEFIAGHQQAIQEIDAKLNALVDIGKMQGGMETRPS
jgi:hypothetical protein